MEQTSIFRAGYEVTPDDLNDLQAYAQASLDRVVAQTLVPGRRFFGFQVTAPSSTTLKVGDGLLFFDGRRYLADTDGAGTPITVSLAGLTQSRIIAIVAYPQDQDTNVQVEERDYEIDANTQTYEPRSVNVRTLRRAQIQSVSGPEGVQPQPPPDPSNAVVIAYVTVTPGGIQLIAMQGDSIVPNLVDVNDRLLAAELGLEDILPKVATLRSDLAKVDERTRNVPDGKLLDAVAQDVAELKVRGNLGQDYVRYRSNDFTSTALSDTAYAGYSAKVDEGLRFAAEAIAETQLTIQNPFNPDAKISGAGLLLPKWVNSLRRIVRGKAGTFSLAQYAYEARSLTVASMTRQRIRYGAEFEASPGFLSGATYYATLDGVKNVFMKNGETFQAYDTGVINPDGTAAPVRLAQYWKDSVTSPYWKRIATDALETGYAWVQGFVQTQSAWVTAIHPKFTGKPSAGTIKLGLMALKDGQPDFSNVLAIVTCNPGDFPQPVPLNDPGIAIEPTFLEAGKRYGFFLLTASDYVVDFADATANAGGTLFYGVGGGVYYPDPTRNIMFDLSVASFEKGQVSIDLTPLSLSGGIATIDILADAITPAGTFAFFEVQIAGVWKKLDESAVSILASLPPLLPTRYTIIGSPDLMGGLKLSGSRCRVSRPKTTFKHVETALSMPGGAVTDKVTVKSTLTGFNPGLHTYTAKVLVGAGYATVETADVTTDEVRPDGTVIRTQVFNLAGPVSSIKIEEDGTATSPNALFVARSAFALAVDVP